MGDDPTKPGRAGSMSDTDRALVGRDRRRSPAVGVPAIDPALAEQLMRLAQLEADLIAEADEFDEQFTPVAEVLALANTARERDLVLALWQHSANQELRFRRQRKLSSEGALRRDTDANTKAITDIHGASGGNGKLGELRRRVDSLSKAAWWFVTAVIGGIGAAAVKLVMVVRAFDAVENTAQHNSARLLEQQARILRLETELLTRFRPADAPDRSNVP